MPRRPSWHVSLDDAVAKLPGDGAEFNLHYALRHGSMRLGLYAPRDDHQTPHRQDELYIVAAGHGVFDKGGTRTAFAAPDTLFVEAGTAHRFVEVSDDFMTWVVFWGPDGGEAAGI